ncbi:MAG: DUF4230 domain-containing protein [Clostridia bacterium]|nr:DUF4230 domain-containing protein [Clostridia bacterium]
MRKLFSILILLGIIFAFTSCSSKSETTPEIVQMKNICELATLKCYYRNVAKHYEENAEVFLWSKKHRKFWIEYSGVVTMGIDASKLDLEIKENVVTIIIPKAQVLDCRVEDISKASFIIDEGGAEVSAEYQTKTLDEAQMKMKEVASQNAILLNNAQQRVKDLLEDYVKNIGMIVGKEYTVEFIELDETASAEENSTTSTTQV